MARRYHQSRRDRMHEREGMERYMRNSRINHAEDRFNDEHHAEKDRDQRDLYRGPLTAAEDFRGMPTSMRSGLEKDGMIREDHRAIANLPQEVMIKPYPRTGPYMPEPIDDTIRGVDGQMDYDDSQRASHFYPKKV